MKTSAHHKSIANPVKALRMKQIEDFLTDEEQRIIEASRTCVRKNNVVPWRDVRVQTKVKT